MKKEVSTRWKDYDENTILSLNGESVKHVKNEIVKINWMYSWISYLKRY